MAPSPARALDLAALRTRLVDELRPRLREFKRGAHAFRKSLVAVVGLVLILAFTLIAVGAPLLAPPPAGSRDPLIMNTNLEESWCPAFGGYNETWSWAVVGASPTAHLFEMTIVLPPLAEGYRPRDASFEVVLLNSTDKVMRLPARGAATLGLPVPVDWYVNETFRQSTASIPNQADRLALQTDAPGNWTVMADTTRGDYRVQVIFHVIVPSETQRVALVRIPLTKFVMRPSGASLSLQVNSATDCAGTPIESYLGAPVGVQWFGGGHPLPYDRVLPFDDAAVVIGVPMEARYTRPASTLGTTVLGMDIYYGIVWGSQVSIRIGLEVVFFSLVIGMLLGLFAGYYGGWIDEMLMRVTDIFFGIPSLILAMAVIVAIQPTLENLVLALVAVSWPGYARLIRGVTLSVKTNLYVEASRASGARAGTILRRHIFPNTVSSVMVQASLDIGSVVLVAAGLSFIGLSFATPQTAEWGRMVSDGQSQFGASSFAVWWPVFYPGMCIFLFVLGFNMLGDGLRDVLDPRLRR